MSIRVQSTTVRVEADENLQRHIQVSNSRGYLVISTDRDRCLRSSNPIAVHITTPNLEKIRLAGSGNIDCGAFDTPDMEVELDGSGNIYIDRLITDHAEFTIDGSGYIESEVDAFSVESTIEGSGEIRLFGVTDVADMLITGSGRIRANEMDANDCYATITGSGDIYTFVFDLLDATISGSGSVYYYGNPSQVVKRISGSGNVIRRN
ncbi:MAG: DUF2807 domain-containing protein [Bacteroidales bacterium]|nr:DUF2807 domain-containing protein [Bacteroidales bacterium]